MSSKLIPADPSAVMVIRDVTPNVVTFSVPFLRFGRLPVGGRGTLVRLTSGALAVFSPVALTADVHKKIEQMGGDVRYIIAGDIEHHIFISDWAQAFPQAKLVGPEGLPEKRLKMHDDKVGKEPFAVVFEGARKRELEHEKQHLSVDADFDRDFDVEYVDAHPNKEVVLFYRPDRVLIEADLLFNLPGIEQYSRVPEADRPKPGALGRFFFSLQTAQGEGKGKQRFQWYLMSAANRPSFNESIRRIHSWDFEILIPCHGETIMTDAKKAFENVFEWHLTATK